MRHFGIWLATSALCVGCTFSGGSSQNGVPDGGLVLDDAGNLVPDAGDDGGVDGPNCGSPGSFIDTFDSDSRRWFARPAGDSAAPFEIAGGVLRINLTQTLRGGSSLFSVDMRNAAVSFQIAELLGNQASAFVRIVGRNDTTASFELGGSNGGSLTTRSPSDSGVMVNDYQAENDRGMRFRLAGPDLVFELRRTGEDWREIRKLIGLDPSDFRHVRLEVQAVATDGGSVGSSFAIDDVNADAVVAPWCAVGALDDDFADDVLDPVWFPLFGPDCVETGATAEAGGRVVFDSEASNGTRCSLFSAPAYSFDDEGMVTIQIPPNLVANNNYQAFLRLTSRLGTFVSLRLRNGQTCAFAVDNGTVEDILNNCRDYDPTETFWRIAVESGMVRLEVSADNLNWTIIDQDVLPFPSSPIDVGFGIDVFNTNGLTQFSVESIASE